MNNNSKHKVPLLCESVFKIIEERIGKVSEKQLLDEELLMLHSVFGAVLQRALDILEKYPTLTTYVTASKLRSLVEIKGENNHCYRVFPNINYCPCYAFNHQVLEKKSQILCKHILAARIALILGKTEEHVVTPEQHLMLIKSMYNLDEKHG